MWGYWDSEYAKAQRFVSKVQMMRTSNVKALESPELDEHDKKRLNKIFKEVSEYI